MSTAHVQTKDAQSSSGTSLGISLTGVVAGNHLVVSTATSTSGSGSPIADNAPTSSPSATWLASQAQTNSTTGGAGSVSQRMDHSENVASGAWTVTLHCASLTELTGIVSESSGVATSSSLGAHSGAQSASGGATTVQPGSITPTAGSILYTSVTDSNSTTTADTIDSGFTISSDSTAWNGTNQRAGQAHKDNVAAAAVNPTWTGQAGMPSGQVALIAEFVAASGTPFPISGSIATQGGATATLSVSQIAMPSVDVNAVWTSNTGATTSLYSYIDEVPTPNDSDYIQSPLAPANSEQKVRLQSVTNPQTTAGFSVGFRYGKDLPLGSQEDVTVTLYAADGVTVIASQTVTAIGDSVAYGSFTLTGTQAASIPSADYATGLVLGFKANQTLI